MGTIRSYEDLDVYNVAVEQVKVIYWLTGKLPPSEKSNLKDQLERAAVSVPSNISEGQTRSSTKEFLYFLSVARGSNSEIRTQITIGISLGYFRDYECKKFFAINKRIGQMLYNLIESLNRKLYTEQQDN